MRNGQEITCCAVLLHHGEALEKDAAQQVAWEPKDIGGRQSFVEGQEATRGSGYKAHGVGTHSVQPCFMNAQGSLAQAAERAAEKRWEKANEVSALGRLF